jgi:hypothetical protein
VDIEEVIEEAVEEVGMDTNHIGLVDGVFA